MSTRCTTHFVDSVGVTDAIVYRHSDGYPEGAGTDLLVFIDRCKQLRDSRIDDPTMLAARYVVYLADLFGNPVNRIDFMSVRIMLDDPGDIEYRYTVHPDGKVACYDIEKQKNVRIPRPKGAKS